MDFVVKNRRMVWVGRDLKDLVPAPQLVGHIAFGGALNAA